MENNVSAYQVENKLQNKLKIDIEGYQLKVQQKRLQKDLGKKLRNKIKADIQTYEQKFQE